MAVSVLEIFKVGIGPSSSHTVGPMRAARMFTLALAEQGVMTSVTRVLSEMFGSLGATGKGHGTDSAVLLGLSGHEPDTVDVDQVPAILEGIRGSSSLLLQGAHRIALAIFSATHGSRLSRYMQQALNLSTTGTNWGNRRELGPLSACQETHSSTDHQLCKQPRAVSSCI